MHADLMLLRLLSLDHDFHEEVKAGQKLMSISLLSSFRDHPGLAKFCTVHSSQVPTSGVMAAYKQTIQNPPVLPE